MGQDASEKRADQAPWPTWALLLVGGLFADTLARRELRALDPAWVAAAEGLDAEDDPLQMSARELRRIPGVGETRALELVRARERHTRQEDRSGAAEPFRWSSVRGVGPVTEERISRWGRDRRSDAAGDPAGELPPDPRKLQSSVESEAWLQAHFELALSLGGAHEGGRGAATSTSPLREP